MRKQLEAAYVKKLDFLSQMLDFDFAVIAEMFTQSKQFFVTSDIGLSSFNKFVNGKDVKLQQILTAAGANLPIKSDWGELVDQFIMHYIQQEIKVARNTVILGHIYQGLKEISVCLVDRIEKHATETKKKFQQVRWKEIERCLKSCKFVHGRRSSSRSRKGRKHRQGIRNRKGC